MSDDLFADRPHTLGHALSPVDRHQLGRRSQGKPSATQQCVTVMRLREDVRRRKGRRVALRKLLEDDMDS